MMNISESKGKFVYIKLENDLRTNILNGKFVPEFPLPGEVELAAQYNISRPSARKALQVLVKEGLLTRRRGEGTFVVPPEHRKTGLERRSLHIAIGISWLNEGLTEYDNRFLEGASEYALRGGHKLSFFASDKFDNKKLIGKFRKGLLDAIVWGSIPTANLQKLDELIDCGIPQITIHQSYKDLPYMICNYIAAVKKTFNLLFGVGHKNVGFINCSHDQIIYNDYEKSYTELMAELGKDYKSYYRRIPNNDLEKEFNDLASWIKRLDALILGGFSYLLPMLNWLDSHNIIIPDDLSLVCFDDSAAARTYSVPISVYENSRVEQGKQAIHSIEALVRKQLGPYERIIVQGELIVRDSCKLPNIFR
ncbi:MAG: substrate-binding domain-containing protein [Victivallaceae bacterium]|jgi:DNA-binding LacI/PurR family transcriptional regulator